ncbi:MAG: CPBP family intramembrane metalloprotease [Acidobacteriia bacterium]|nr:CPBP family intramembrane metalloprotease [Terriglobia bacterium]MYG03866.1 CPBP family intramembrane metalloprotease [Terriglobia bacterium]MYK10813.1 CPBP family intramembrane metalloprotease [Terriglobia bacterium]
MGDEFQFRIESETGHEATPGSPPRQQAPWGYREILLLVAVALLAQLLVTAAAVAFVGRGGDFEPYEVMERLRVSPHVVVPLQMLTWLPVLACLWYMVAVRHGLPLRTGLAWKPLPRSARTYFRTGALLAFGSALLSIAIGDRTASNPMTELLSDPAALWLIGLFGVFVAPCIEELVFRGFLFGALERMHGTGAALLISSAVFTALHGSQYGWQWPQLVVLGLVGIAFGAVRIRSGSTMASTIVHAAYNGMLLVALIGMGRWLS